MTDIIINTITDEIISRMNPNFNKLQKIRFIYLELGKYVEKNITFFKNDDLGEYALTREEKNNLYQNDYLEKRTIHFNTQYQIICKSAARFLQTAFKKVGIECECLRTTLGDNGIYHWFVVAQDDNNNQYFLTLAADLPYIKNNMPTEHFASDLRYLNDDGTPSYVLPNNKSIILSTLDNGVQEVLHTVLEQQELYELDKSIGYSKLYDVKYEDLTKALKNKYATYLEENSDVYKIFLNSFNADEDHSFKIDDITIEQIDIFYKKIINYITNNSKVPNLNLSDKDYLIYLLEKANISVDDESLTIDELLNKYRKELKKIKDNEYIEVIRLYQNALAIKNNLNALLVKKQEFLNMPSSIEKDNLGKKLKRLVVSIRELLYIISYYFLDSNIYIKDNTEYIPTEYIVRKFIYMFPVVFDCNYDGEENVDSNNSTVLKNNFSVQNYSEQIVIIKMLLKDMFPELTIFNSSEIEDYNYTYSPVDNRIQAYPIINRETKEYCIGFYFGKKVEEGEIYYIYIPSLNKLERRNPTEDYKKYYSVSKRFESQNRIEEIEYNLNDNQRIK